MFRLLNNRADEFNSARNPQFSEHQQAKALSIFLANASLATPALDRETVAAIIAGERGWPYYQGKESVISSDIPLSVFEEAGLLSFYADWCHIHAQKVTDIHALDQSIQKILRVVEHLRCLSEGYKDHIQPHFAIKKDKLQKLLSDSFGNIAFEMLLPELEENEDICFILPESRDFNQLDSTYLWQMLLQQLPAEEAFRRWLLCSIVHGRAVIPVQFSLLDAAERQTFLLQTESYFATDPAISSSLKILFKQVTNDRILRQILEPRNYAIELQIGGGKPEISETAEKEQPCLTAEMLGSVYRYPEGEDFTNLAVLGRWAAILDYCTPLASFTWLLNECIDEALTISHSELTARSFVDNVIAHSESRNILKFMLFCDVSLRHNTKYLLYLLSREDTCDIAFFHLTNREYLHTVLPIISSMSGIENSFRDILITEYLLAASNNEDVGSSLLNVMLYLADACGFYSDNYTESVEYRIISELLSRFDDSHLIQLATTFLKQPLDSINSRITIMKERSLYYVGFRVLERIEKSGIPDIDTLRRELHEYLLAFYVKSFTDSINSNKRDLEPDDFFASLPWGVLVGSVDIKSLLNLSTNYSEWGALLAYDNENSYKSLSAIAQYIQMLMCIVNENLEDSFRQRVWRRITDIVSTHGFGPSETRQYLFAGYSYKKENKLWKTFCLFMNTLPDALYEDFFEQCRDKTPVNALYEQLAYCNVYERKMELQALILTRGDIKDEGLSLSDLDDAFVAACGKGHMKLASGINDAAQKILERLRTYDSHHFRDSLVRWEGYTYKYKLLTLFENLKDNPVEFETQANDEVYPVLTGVNQQNILARSLHDECEWFRIYIIAAAFCATEPEKCVRFMEPLVEKNKSLHYAYLLFKGRIVLSHKKNDHVGLKYALNHFLLDVDNKKPEDMDVEWVASILSVMQELKDKPHADSFWQKLMPEQRRTREILLPYCKILSERGEFWIVQQILNDFKQLNSRVIDSDPDLILLVEEISRALPDESPVIGIMRAMAESSQRSVQQLKQHYASIVTSHFNDYVKIVGGGRTPEEYLKDIIIEIANEILMRKTNLQIQVDGKIKGSTVQQIAGEDLINDWFTSLFDKRMAEARIGFRDQKRTGQSSSGKNPGESDGLITHATNTRIAIFEAFRLFSCSRKTIEEHLNKISGYDQEALSPVFVVAYCDVNNFSNLITDYGKLVSTMSYTGFTCVPDSINTLEKTDQLWIGREVCFRNSKEVVFYHLLLNMR